jgi:hypothetical protein
MRKHSTPRPAEVELHVSAFCLVHRHARCRGRVITLLADRDCQCACHAVSVPTAWKPAA